MEGRRGVVASSSRAGRALLDDESVVEVATRDVPELQEPAHALAHVFFGYMDRTVAAVRAEEAEAERARVEREEAIVKRQHNARREAIAGSRKTAAERRHHRDNKVRTMLKNHHQAKLDREKEKAGAKRMMGDRNELQRFLEDFEAESVALEKANASELAVLEKHNLGKDTEDELHHRAMEAEADSAELAESLEKPAGASSRRTRASRRACVEALDEACVELEQAQRDLENTREDLMAQVKEANDAAVAALEDGTAAPGAPAPKDGLAALGPEERSMLILVEGRVAQCERTVEDALTALDEAEAVLERAVRRKGKEERS